MEQEWVGLTHQETIPRLWPWEEGEQGGALRALPGVRE